MWKQLMEAIKASNATKAETFIAQMGDKELGPEDEFGNTLLHLAIDKGLDTVAEKLVEKMNQTTINKPKRDGSNALHLAIGNGSEKFKKIAEKLLEKMDKEDDKEAINKRKSDDSTALHLAVGKGFETVTEKLLEKMDQEAIGYINRNGETALYYAIVFKNSPKIAAKLIVKMRHEDLNLLIKGNTALYYAIDKYASDKQDWEVIAEILVKRMSPEAISLVNKDGHTVLHKAINKELSTLGLILAKKMNQGGVDTIYRSGSDSYTALHLAIKKDFIKVAEELIEKMSQDAIGATWNDYNKGGTALHLAVEKGFMPIAKKLAEKMSYKAINSDGHGSASSTYVADTALNIADKKGSSEIVKNIKYWKLVKVIQANQLNQATALIGQMSQEELGYVNQEKWTALHWAAYKGYEKIAGRLLGKMRIKDINAKDEDGWTALHWAAYNGDKPMANTLLAIGGLNTSLVDKNHSTALHLASAKKHVEIVEILMPKMTKDAINAQDKDGWTALHWAAYNKSEEIKQKLTDKMSPEAVTAKDKNGYTASDIDSDINKGSIKHESKPDKLDNQECRTDTGTSNGLNEADTLTNGGNPKGQIISTILGNSMPQKTSPEGIAPTPVPEALPVPTPEDNNNGSFITGNTGNMVMVLAVAGGLVLVVGGAIWAYNKFKGTGNNIDGVAKPAQGKAIDLNKAVDMAYSVSNVKALLEKQLDGKAVVELLDFDGGKIPKEHVKALLQQINIKPVIVPIHLHGKDWAGMIIKHDDSNLKIIYIDPTGTYDQDPNAKALIGKIDKLNITGGSIIKLEYKQGAKDIASGLLIVEDLIKLANAKTVGLEVPQLEQLLTTEYMNAGNILEQHTDQIGQIDLAGVDNHIVN
jgi:ankyrin repeat protein